MSSRYLISIFGILFMLKVSAQDNIYQQYDIYRNPIRVFLNLFSLTATTGYGATNYKHDLSGVFFLQDENGQYIFSNNENPLNTTFTGYANWLNSPEIGVVSTLENPFVVPFEGISNPVFNPALVDSTFLTNTDTTSLGFEGVNHSIPIHVSLHFNLKKFRIGGGFSYEKQFSRSLEPTNYSSEVRAYEPNYNSTRFTRWYGLAGYNFYSWWWNDFVAELNVGKINSGPQFNSAAITRGLYYNIGISIENNWSEYFRVIVKPSFDIKSYDIALPDGSSIQHKQNTFFLQVGVSLNFPDIRRSPMKNDHTQLKHVYTDPKTGRREEVRGQNIFNRQNPKIGENQRTLKRHMPSRKNRVKSKKKN